MTKQDRRNAGILVLLLAVLGLTVFLGYRMTRPPATAVAQTPEQQKVAVNTLAPGDAKIRVDLVEKETGEENIGKRNLFQYRQAPPPPPPPVPPRGSGANPFGPGNSGCRRAASLRNSRFVRRDRLHHRHLRQLRSSTRALLQRAHRAAASQLSLQMIRVTTM